MALGGVPAAHLKGVRPYIEVGVVGFKINVAWLRRKGM
jgi:hypothetical protein